ncbi:MAG: protein kinase, partial [Verrucomicrobia bacterium]|nr:protein kinase [Verrucomicrobiota bacterium]
SIKVADLGLAHTVKTMANQPGADAKEVIITGTPNYMAPEQVRGSDPIDCRTDIYALGASLYHMVTGQLPFGDSPPDIVMERQLQEAFEYPQKVNPDLSVSVTRLILKMTAKEPTARFQTWDEVLAEVVRLERQMRQQAAVAGAAALTERPPAADSKKNDNILAGSGPRCRYCGQPVQPQALYCGFCGKSVVAPAKEPVEDQKQSTIRLKPIHENSTASAKPAAIHLKPMRSKPPVNGKPAAAPPVPASQMRHASGHKHLSWSGNVYMVLSLCLLTFLGYYAYQKIKYDHDVIIPIKAAIIRAVQSVQGKSRLYTAEGLQGGAQLSHRLLWARFMAKPALPVDLPTVAPKETPVPDETPAPIESSESEVAQESESSPTPAVTTEPKATETAVSATPVAPMQSETPPPPAVSAPSPVSEKSLQEIEWERLLAQCKQQQPKVGERVTITFNNQQKKIEAILDRVTADGIMVNVPPGFVEYPFRLMSAESRLMFFPEERARHIQSQQVKKSE